jgi:copper chaperone CopZ
MERMDRIKVSLKLSGLSCMGCVSMVKSALEKAGAQEVNVSLDKAEFSVEKGEKIEKFIEAVKKAGYGAEVEN